MPSILFLSGLPLMPIDNDSFLWVSLLIYYNIMAHNLWRIIYSDIVKLIMDIWWIRQGEDYHNEYQARLWVFAIELERIWADCRRNCGF